MKLCEIRSGVFSLTDSAIDSMKLAETKGNHYGSKRKEIKTRHLIKLTPYVSIDLPDNNLRSCTDIGLTQMTAEDRTGIIPRTHVHVKIRLVIFSRNCPMKGCDFIRALECIRLE